MNIHKLTFYSLYLNVNELFYFCRSILQFYLAFPSPVSEWECKCIYFFSYHPNFFVNIFNKFPNSEHYQWIIHEKNILNYFILNKNKSKFDF